MSMSTESTASSEDPVLLENVFLAGCRKNFVGKRRDQFSRNEITTINIGKLVEQEQAQVEKIPYIDHCQFSKTMTFVLGASRVHEKAATFLLEDLTRLTADLDYFLSYSTKKESSKPKKTKKIGKKSTDNAIEDLDIDVESILSWKHVENYDILAKLEQGCKTDENLLNEIDISHVSVDLPPFGDEIYHRDGHEDDVHNRSGEFAVLDLEAPERPSTPTPSTLTDSTASRGDSHSVTPKRRKNGSHDETPKKRQKKLLGNANLPGKGISQNLFGRDKPSIPISPIETIRRETNQQEVQPVQEHFLNKEFPVIPRPRVSHSNIEVVPDLPQDPQPEEVPVPDVISPNFQRLPDVSLPNLNDMQLEELDDESLVRQRHRRAIVIADEKTMIQNPSEMIIKKGFVKVSKLHTRPMQLADPQKPVSDLFLFPATNSWRSGGPCTWGKPLLGIYSRMARQILRPSCGEPRANSEPRDRRVDYHPRLSDGLEADPTVPEDQPQLVEDMDDSNKRDKGLMPPPSNHPILSRPSNKQPAGLATPDNSYKQQDGPPSLPSSPQHQLPQQKAPHTPNNKIIRGQDPIISPKARTTPKIFITPDPGENDADLPNDSAAMSPSTASTRERSCLMEEHEFYTYLEDLWSKEFEKIRSNTVALEKVILRRYTRITFHRYFTYLQRFQVEGKLTMTQDHIWGLVCIAKTIE